MLREWGKDKAFWLSLAISYGAGVLGTLLTLGKMGIYTRITQPPLAPPGWLFPVVWTVLYFLMGLAAYLVYRDCGSTVPLQQEKKADALSWYLSQLLLNIVWPILFFRFEAFWLAFLCIVGLWGSILMTYRRFRTLCPAAGIMMLIYLVWVSFAAYLNLAIALLN